MLWQGSKAGDAQVMGQLVTLGVQSQADYTH